MGLASYLKYKRTTERNVHFLPLSNKINISTNTNIFVNISTVDTHLLLVILVTSIETVNIFSITL